MTCDSGIHIGKFTVPTALLHKFQNGCKPEGPLEEEVFFIWKNNMFASQGFPITWMLDIFVAGHAPQNAVEAEIHQIWVDNCYTSIGYPPPQ